MQSITGQSLSLKPEPNVATLHNHGSEVSTTNSSPFHIYHFLEQRRIPVDDDLSDVGTQLLRLNEITGLGENKTPQPERPFRRRRQVADSQHATTKQTNQHKSDQAKRNQYHSTAGVGSSPAGPRAKRRLRWRDRRREGAGGSRRRNGRRARPRRDRRRRRRHRRVGEIAACSLPLDLDSDLCVLVCVCLFSPPGGKATSERAATASEGDDRVDGEGRVGTSGKVGSEARD